MDENLVFGLNMIDKPLFPVSLYRLKINNSFKPILVNVEDELFRNGIFIFNISRIIHYINDNLDKINTLNVKVSDFNEGFSSINESHVDSVDISQPVILAEISSRSYSLIDGHHRMEKASQLNVKILKAYLLPVEQHIDFLTSKESYLSYVEYWNGKLVDYK